MDIVRDFVASCLAAAGGVVELRPDALDALLPPDAASALDLPEEVCIFSGATSGATECSIGAVDGRLGSTLVDRLLDARLAVPPLAAMALPAELPRALPPNLPVLLNAVSAEVAERPTETARYLIADLRLVLEGDERRSELTSVCVRLRDGALVQSFRLASAYPIAASPATENDRVVMTRALRTFILREAPAVVAGALETVVRRARRDLERLADYFSSLDVEMARAAARARNPDERARRQAKRAALREDLGARRAQLRRRLSPRLSAQLVAATMVHTDVQPYAVAVRRRTNAGHVAVYRRTADNVFEGPACAACSRATLRLYLCDDRLHPLCEHCGQAGRLDPSRCRACTRSTPAPPALSLPDPTTVLHLGGGAVAETTRVTGE